MKSMKMMKKVIMGYLSLLIELMNTQAMFLQKVREPQCKQSDDEEWLGALGTSGFRG